MPLLMHEAIRQFLMVLFPVFDHPVTIVRYPFGIPGSFIASANACGIVMNSVGLSAADFTKSTSLFTVKFNFSLIDAIEGFLNSFFLIGCFI